MWGSEGVVGHFLYYKSMVVECRYREMWRRFLKIYSSEL
jgi:hypothetical protein